MLGQAPAASNRAPEIGPDGGLWHNPRHACHRPDRPPMTEWLSSLQSLLTAMVAAGLGVRELIVALLVIVVIYMLVVIFRMKSLSTRKRFEALSAARYESDLLGDPAAEGGERKTRRGDEAPPAASLSSAPGKSRLDRFYDAPPRNEPKNKYFEPPEVDREPAPPPVSALDQEKLLRLERELNATREELDALRAAFAATRDAHAADIERLKAGQRVSPTYNDSLRMAMAGASAEEIAASCGIARAEAELVMSLARGGRDPAPAGPEAGEANDPDRTKDDRQLRRSRYGSY